MVRGGRIPARRAGHSGGNAKEPGGQHDGSLHSCVSLGQGRVSRCRLEHLWCCSKEAKQETVCWEQGVGTPLMSLMREAETAAYQRSPTLPARTPHCGEQGWPRR